MAPEEFLKDRYQLLHRLGEGSGGLVYKARQISTGQTVAVKVLRLDDAPNELNERRLERFRREVAFCSNLSHPDIVRILDSGDLNESLHFAVFEFIPGVTLAELLSEQGALPVRRAYRLMMQVLPPLAHAHAHGIFHRDLKPSNLMITADGERDRLKILDFGISIATGRNFPLGGRLTLSHEWVGTPSYASPEQLRGETVGTGSDLYAWGLMFVECLTGTSVVSGKSLPEIIRQQLVPEPHELPPALQNHRLGMLLSRVLDKDVARRPGDVAALLSILETISIDDLGDQNGYLKDYVADGARPRARSAAFDTLVSEPRRDLTELRRATIVCCKLAIVGPSDAVGAEQLDTVLNDTTALLRETLGRFGATVSRSFGQYSLAYFGLLRTRDADARMALEAGLEIINRVESGPTWLTEAGLALHAQVGIHNGPVTVQLNDGSRREVEGVTAAIAMRLASLNDEVPSSGRSPVRLIVSGEFHELVSRHARFERIVSGASLRDLPGEGAMPAYRFVSNTGLVATNIPAARFASFVGRRAEMEDLLAWRNRGTGEAVLISGDPGIGKSRLALELDQRLRNQGVEWLEVRCLPEWQNGFLRPLAKMCLQDLSLADPMPSGAAARVAELVMDLGLDARQAVPLLCAWLSLPTPDAYPPLSWSPQKQRLMLLQTLADLLIARMERGTAIRVEDLHWADPSTLDCLNALLTRARGHAVFILMTTRPGLRQTWLAAPHVIELGGLDPSAAHELTKSLVPRAMLDAPALARIVERSDGVPLYIEELAMVFRGDGAGAPEDSRTIERERILAPGTVPPSLHDLLASRLDDTGDSKQLAQFAATVGREFSLDVLATLLERDPLSMLGDVEQLLRAEILVRRSGHDGNRYAFRHALIREAAYESMTPGARRRTHERVASGLESNFPALADSEPDVMAHHWEAAGDAQRAVSYWQQAARKSNMASAHLEGLAQLQRGLALVDQLPPEVRSRREAELLLARGATIVTKRGYTDPLASTSFERVAALVPASGETVELAFAARWGLWYFHNTQANLPTARHLAEELNQIAAASGDSAMTVSAFEAVCETNFCIGNLDECIRASRRCAEIYDFDRHRHLSTVRGDDPHLASLSFEAFAQIVSGQPSLACQRVQEGLALAHRLGYPAMKAGMHCQAAWVHLVWGGSGARRPDVEEARRHAQIAIDLANELGFRFWTVYGRILDAAAAIAAGDAGALDRLREGSDIWKGAGANLGRCWHLTFMAQALHRSRQIDAALAVLEAALAFCDEHDSRFFEPEIWRHRAEIWLDPENPQRDVETGLAACAQANERAAARGAHWWRLAATTTAVRAGDEQSRTDLEQLLARFPVQAHEPPLLREARQLLCEPPARAVTA